MFILNKAQNLTGQKFADCLQFSEPNSVASLTGYAVFAVGVSIIIYITERNHIGKHLQDLFYPNIIVVITYLIILSLTMSNITTIAGATMPVLKALPTSVCRKSTGQGMQRYLSNSNTRNFQLI